MNIKIFLNILGGPTTRLRPEFDERDVARILASSARRPLRYMTLGEVPAVEAVIDEAAAERRELIARTKPL